MPEARNRPPARRRDRSDEVDEFGDDIDATQTPAVSPKSTVVSRRDYDENDEVEDLDPEVEEEDETPVRSNKTSSRSALPPGIRVGFAGVEETRKSAGASATRLALSGDPVLVKFLENEPFVTYRQHWMSQGGGQPDRPYVCIGVDCPLCAIGDNASQTIAYNVLHLNTGGEPTNKVAYFGIRAYNALLEAASDKATGAKRVERDFWAVNRSGKGQQSQTNFRPVKQRDLEDDWTEILESFDIDDLPQIIENAKGNVFDFSIVSVTSRQQLLEVAKFATSSDD